MIRPTFHYTVRAASILPLVPVLAATIFIIAANVVIMGSRLPLPYPSMPWEAGFVTDGWRMLHGEAVYAVGTDHATHAYGPLVTVLLAQAFRLTGPQLYVGRLLSAISGIATVVILARVFGRGNWLAFGVGAALLLAANSRTSSAFTETRPDLDAFFFATVALVVLFRGLETEQPRPFLILIGSALLVVAVLFKQTAIVSMFIPMLAVLGRRGIPSRRRHVLAAAVPIASVLFTLALIRQVAPGLWHFFVEVQSGYHISGWTAAKIFIEFPASLALFLVVVMHWLLTDAPDTWRLPLGRWLIAALVCTIPASILYFAKVGAWTNSLIPALLSVGAFCAWRAPVAVEVLRSDAWPLPSRIAVGTLLGILMLDQSLLYRLGADSEPLSRAALKGGHGVNERALVIATVRSLPGKVVCPDDPTIPLIAKGYAGRTAVFEADAVQWNPGRMQAIAREMDSADYVIVMRHGLSPAGKALVTTNLDWGDKDQMLRAGGFTRAEFHTFSTPVYELWHRTPPGPPSALAY